MTLEDVFTQLTVGELSQLHIGANEQGKIDESNHTALIAHVNLALMALYKRFPLKQERLTLKLIDGRSTYALNSQNAVSNRRADTPFIMDSRDEPFGDDILKIESVFTQSGYELGLNDEGDILACSTPTASTLRVPTAIVQRYYDLPQEMKTDTLTVHYRASHPIISKGMGFFDPARVELELPYTHLEPLLYYIASRAHNPTGMLNEFHMGNSYAAKYEQACLEIEMRNLRVDQGGQSAKFRDRGWV